MIKLIATYHADILPDTHLHIAKVMSLSIQYIHCIHILLHTVICFYFVLKIFFSKNFVWNIFVSFANPPYCACAFKNFV